VELFSNTLWFFLFGGAMLAWFWHLGRSGKKQVLQGAVALAGSFLLLFPVISVSDDVHAAQFAVEDATLSKKLQRSAATITSALQFSAFPAAQLTLLHGPQWHTAGMVRGEIPARIASVPRSCFEIRGPPAT